MPLIRYKIGDIATGTDFSKECQCKRGLPRIQKLFGRDVEVFRRNDGTLIDGEFFTHLFYYRSWVKKFQVVQEDFNRVTIYIVKEGNSNTQNEQKEIEQSVHKVMGEECVLRWSFVSQIDPLASGKFLYTISKVKML